MVMTFTIGTYARVNGVEPAVSASPLSVFCHIDGHKISLFKFYNNNNCSWESSDIINHYGLNLKTHF